MDDESYLGGVQLAACHASWHIHTREKKYDVGLRYVK